MARVVGIDPGTVSFDLCGLEGGELAFTARVPTSEIVDEPERLARSLPAADELDAVVGPSGYGLPLRRLSELDDRAVRLAFLSVPGGTGGIPRLVEAMSGLREADVPVWIVPGVVHLPTVPAHRKVNRVDMGTADKVCAAALGAADQVRRLGAPPERADFLLVELGGAFTSVLSVQEGAVVDGLGGSSGPPGVRAPGGLDGEVAVVLERVTKRHVFSGGAAAVARGRPAGGDGGDPDPAAWATSEGPARVAWEHLMEGIEKACRSLLAVHPRPRELLVSGRYAGVPAVAERLEETLGSLAPVRRPEGLTDRVSTAAQGAALLADGLAGGEHEALVDRFRLRDATGTVFDHVYLDGAAEGAARWLEGTAS